MYVPGVSGKTVAWILVAFCVQQVQTKCKFILKDVMCGRIFNAQAHCEITEAGRIISVSVSKQISWAPCYKSRKVVFHIPHRANYGFRDNILWVRDWCKAKFSVCYRSRISTTTIIQSTPSRDLTISSQMTSKHPGRKQTFATVSFSSKSTTLGQMSSESQTLSSQREFKVSSTEIYTHVATTKKTTLKQHAYVSSLLMKASTSTDESLSSVESTTLNASMTHRASTTDVPLVAIVAPIVIIVIGALAATIFLCKRRYSSDSKSKANASKTDCNVSFHDIDGAGLHADGCNIMKTHSIDLQSGDVYATVNRAHKQQTLRPVASNKTNPDSELCYINTKIVDPACGKFKIKGGDRIKQHSDEDSQINITGKGALELSDETIDGETPESNHNYFILEKQKDSIALYCEKTDIQMLPEDVYNVININAKEILRDPNYDALEMQGGNIDGYSDEYSHLSQIQTRGQDDVNYSHCKFKN